MKQYAYYENGTKEIKTESDLQNYFETCEELSEQKEEGTTFTDWIAENVKMQILIEVNEQIEEIVSFMVSEGTKETNEGNWIFYHEELTEQFNITEEYLNDNINEITSLLNKQEEVSEVEIDSDNISIYFYTEYCFNL